MAIRAPSVKKRCTIAFPIPLPPPVTMATLFASLMLENYGSSMGSVLLPKVGIDQRLRPAPAHAGQHKVAVLVGNATGQSLPITRDNGQAPAPYSTSIA